MSTTTPDMGLVLPDVSSTPGPQWATDVNTAFETVDSHDHSPGNGALVTPAGLDIDVDMPFGGNNATGLRAARFSSQSGVLTATGDIDEVYVVAGDLYYNDAAGNRIQITKNGGVNGTPGSIAGLVSPASASYDGAGTFIWQQNTNTAAAMDAGPLSVRDTTVLAKRVRIKSPAALAADYDLTLPTGLPAGNRLLQWSSGGQVASSLVIPPASVTATPNWATLDSATGLAQMRKQFPTANSSDVGSVQTSSAQTSLLLTSTSFTNTGLENLTITITTSGRPIVLMCVTGSFGFTSTLATQSAQMRFSVTGAATTTVGATQFGAFLAGTAPQCTFPASSLTTLYSAAAGTYTIAAQYLVNNASTGLNVVGVQLVAYEIF